MYKRSNLNLNQTKTITSQMRDEQRQHAFGKAASYNIPTLSPSPLLLQYNISLEQETEAETERHRVDTANNGSSSACGTMNLRGRRASFLPLSLSRSRPRHNNAVLFEAVNVFEGAMPNSAVYSSYLASTAPWGKRKRPWSLANRDELRWGRSLVDR